MSVVALELQANAHRRIVFRNAFRQDTTVGLGAYWSWGGRLLMSEMRVYHTERFSSC